MATDLTDIDIPELRQEQSLREARQFIEQAASVNLDEMSPEVLTVTFREFVPDKHHGYKVEVQHKEISTFVPMFLLNRMLANQKKAQKLRERFKAGIQAVVTETAEEEAEEFFADARPLDFMALTDNMFMDTIRNSEPMLIWQAKEVLAVWQLTEPDMTLKRLLLGLDFEKLNGLFSRFFGAMLLQKKSKA